MGAVLGLARAGLRGRWRALVALGLLVGVVGGGVLGALAGARRTATAYRRLEQATHIDDVRLLVFSTGLAQTFVEAPSVERSWITNFAIGRPELPTEQYFGVIAGPPRPPDLFTPIVIKGRAVREDRIDETTISERIAAVAGLEPGDTLPIRLLTPEEVLQFDTGFGEPDGPRLELRVVGIIRMPGLEEGFAALFGSAALSGFLRGGFVAGQAAIIRLHRGPAGLEEFRTQVRALAAEVPRLPGSEEFPLYEETLPSASRSTVSAASRVLVVGLLAFAGVVLLVGGFITVQAIGRYSSRGSEDQMIERALGMTRGERVLVRAIPAIVPAFVGASIAVAGAIAVSPLTPIGSISTYEPSPGMDVNIAILGLGAGVIVAATITVFAVAAFRATRMLERGDDGRSVSVVAERVGALGGSAPIVLGLRFAFERGRGRTAVPVRSTFVGAILGVTGLIAVASFSAALDRLISTPARYGWQGHFQIVDLKPEARGAMLADRRVAGFAAISSADAGLPDGQALPITAFETLRGTLGWTMTEGRMPATRDEVALGSRLARRLDLTAGDVLELTAPDATMRIRLSVIGVGIGPMGSSDSFADDAVMTPEGFAVAARTQPFTEGYVRLADGVDVNAFTEELGKSEELLLREPPPEVRNLQSLGRLPDVLAGILALIGMAALVNALVVGVRRRRRDIAVLRAIGFVRSQAAATVRTGAFAITATGLAFGIPLGLAVGRSAWRAVAHAAYVAPGPAWPAGMLVLIAPASLALALVASAFPAMRAARLSPAEILRSE